MNQDRCPYLSWFFCESSTTVGTSRSCRHLVQQLWYIECDHYHHRPFSSIMDQWSDVPNLSTFARIGPGPGHVPGALGTCSCLFYFIFFCISVLGSNTQSEHAPGSATWRLFSGLILHVWKSRWFNGFHFQLKMDFFILWRDKMRGFVRTPTNSQRCILMMEATVR